MLWAKGITPFTLSGCKFATGYENLVESLKILVPKLTEAI